MDNKQSFVKLSGLVGDEFTIKQVGNYKWKKWLPEESKMRSEDDWFEGAQKKYAVETDKGLLDLSEGQLGAIMVKCSHSGRADVNSVTVAVKSNGKSGIDIRYYLNPMKRQKAPEESQERGENPEEYDQSTLNDIFPD